MNLSFNQKEEACLNIFNRMGTVFHCVSPENFEVILIDEQEFKDAMLLFAICCKLVPQVKVYTFQFMSNHFHFIVGGNRNDIECLMQMFKTRLGKYINNKRYVNLSSLEFKLYAIDDVEYLRSSIAYCNRNGFVVRDDVTPFTYPWGANGCYFNPVLKRYYTCCKSLAKVAELRSLFRGKCSDKARGLYYLDGCVSPFSFCDIDGGEQIFRDARHYFYCVSKNVESYAKIASLISESVAYTDDDLFTVARKISVDKYGEKNLSLLQASSKLEIAKMLHFQYNAGKKQLMRLLKISQHSLDGLF